MAMNENDPEGSLCDGERVAGSGAFYDFVETVAALRAPEGGCSWNRAQTRESLTEYLVEEAYEAVDAIEARDSRRVEEELGDVLLQVVLQSQIAAEAGEFTIDDVCATVDEKMVRRHPHVFADVDGGDANEVARLWEQIKLAEKEAAARRASESGRVPSLLDDVPRSFPALLQAQKISRKAAAAGFEWDALDGVWAKVREEEAELREAYAAAPKSEDGRMLRRADGVDPLVEAAELEFGDLLFALVNVARHMGIDSESALRRTCAKFRSRWESMEGAARASRTQIDQLTAGELEALWQEAKSREDAEHGSE
ncbi:MAG: nucleoside triphosphate pyrophosphohydrolase [Berryella intestinalis]|uniref:nucleoside triphosphate pyrophosphohydrolase n=1 Tax=Berryella intestinalis TaxID=1531429 RepID=UPI002A764E2D|nr:nucleoside triphosphate pyrophosphohydrolase [Berryella intestinalis]MDY3128915.1 nucleoside triphosphate pyrophosphohydrolase [Berryella intestinalis]